MPLIARQRSRLAVLAVLALVGSLLAVSAVPAVAAGDGEPSQKAPASACVGAATEDAGFTDTAGNFAEDAINCLAHYMIALGTSDGVFSPNDSISRAQMALFMVRAAGVAGAELDDPEDEGLGDIGNWTDTIQNAINQAVGAGIMSGDNGMFNPTGSVSRQDMAVILDAFIEVVNGDDYYEVMEDDADTPFSDLGQVPFAAYNAINRIYELGVASGTGDGTTFGPNDLVSRAQMASFVTRALGHTNARPAGISIQGKMEGTTTVPQMLTVSIRDENHQPVPDAVVDVFSATDLSEIFNDEGACVTNKLETGNCEIGDDDPATEPDGNVTVEVPMPSEPGTVTVKAWSGEVGDKFDADDTAVAKIEIDVTKPGTMTKVTDSLKKHARVVKFGETITYTLQVVNDDGDPVDAAGLSVTIVATEEDITLNADDSAQLRPDIKTTEMVHKTDASGRIEVSFSAVDPDDDKGSKDRVRLSMTLTPATTDGIPTVDSDATDVCGSTDTTGVCADVPGSNQDGIQIVWSDEAAIASTLVLDQAVSYHETNDDGVRNTVTATLVDQYGNPVRNQKVAFWSDAVNPALDAANQDKLGLGGGTPGQGGTADDPADHRTTSRSGVATKSYTREATAADDESISAQYIRIVGCEDALDTCAETDDVDVNAMAITHYWAAAVSATTVTDQTVLVADKDNNTIVLGTASSPQLVTYKAGDQFRIGGATATMEAFEKALSAAGPGGTPAADEVTATIGDDEDDINAFDITTNN